jgi:DNA-binding transcriptional MerR regulator
MNIKKSRIIQIIKEEMQKLTEDDGDDSGLAPVSLTRTTQAPAPSDDLAQIEMQIHFLEEKLAELQARRAELAGEEPEAPDFTDETDPQDETEFAPIPAPALARYRKKMGIE